MLGVVHVPGVPFPEGFPGPGLGVTRREDRLLLLVRDREGGDQLPLPGGPEDDVPGERLDRGKGGTRPGSTIPPHHDVPEEIMGEQEKGGMQRDQAGLGHAHGIRLVQAGPDHLFPCRPEIGGEGGIPGARRPLRSPFSGGPYGERSGGPRDPFSPGGGPGQQQVPQDPGQVPP